MRLTDVWAAAGKPSRALTMADWFSLLDRHDSSNRLPQRLTATHRANGATELRAMTEAELDLLHATWKPDLSAINKPWRETSTFIQWRANNVLMSFAKE